ncbi:hypothetical protein SNOG_08203 [Parastagonospora nodorum SN15]|uniref:Uncharacterized protein n=1 Tax=Phaeosphaeria nodorum (strain SN15 / ATCC MYA-4574 / FGSC 10173) TaxID=321614 RepID=Q0UJ61_PHANO|nr:hypothetical protein SNOG_08203 [Parastagonospora nodorum SN15]EAT84479.1 hypothetical protein SNOG_08203 [Parastagonospora nodorum SN15]
MQFLITILLALSATVLVSAKHHPNPKKPLCVATRAMDRPSVSSAPTTAGWSTLTSTVKCEME